MIFLIDNASALIPVITLAVYKGEIKFLLIGVMHMSLYMAKPTISTTNDDVPRSYEECKLIIDDKRIQ